LSQEDKNPENPEDEEEIIEEFVFDIDEDDGDVGQMIVLALFKSIQDEQRRNQFYFTLIPLAFSFGLLLGYYISFTNL
tara:strand:+ start:12892 stop:13125 length:234 start_codon:yes stop_codon:yes gene_type:complete